MGSLPVSSEGVRGRPRTLGWTDTPRDRFRCGCRASNPPAESRVRWFGSVVRAIPRKIASGICTPPNWVHIVAESSRKTPPNKPFSLPPPPTSVGGLFVLGRSQPASQLARSGVNRAGCPLSLTLAGLTPEGAALAATANHQQQPSALRIHSEGHHQREPPQRRPLKSRPAAAATATRVPDVW